MKSKPGNRGKIINHPDFGPVRADKVSKLQLIEKALNLIPQAVWFDVFPLLTNSFWDEVDKSLQQCNEKELRDIIKDYGSEK